MRVAIFTQSLINIKKYFLSNSESIFTIEDGFPPFRDCQKPAWEDKSALRIFEFGPRNYSSDVAKHNWIDTVPESTNGRSCNNRWTWWHSRKYNPKFNGNAVISPHPSPFIYCLWFPDSQPSILRVDRRLHFSLRLSLSLSSLAFSLTRSLSHKLLSGKPQSLYADSYVCCIGAVCLCTPLLFV